MDTRKLIEEIDSVRQLADNWDEQGQMPEIERGIVLDKLKHIYEQLLFTRPAQTDASPAGEAPLGNIPAPEVHSEQATVPGGQTQQTQISVPPQEPAAAVLGPESDLSVEQKLFGDEQVVRPRMDKQVILSLYGDAPTAPVHQQTAGNNGFRASAAPQDTAHDHTAGINDAAGSKKVLGEAIGNGNGVAMNEVLGKQTAHADVASKLQSQSISGDLRQCIGINDRFMLIRTLFNGSADEYTAAIARLNAFTDLNDALLFIQENYRWDPDGEGVRLIVDLLERKLG